MADKTICEKCSGFLHVQDPESHVWVPCDCLKLAKLKVRLSEIGIEPAILPLTENHLPQAPWATVVKRILEEIKTSLREGKHRSFTCIFSTRDEKRRLLVASLLLKRYAATERTARILTVGRIFELLFDDHQKDPRPLYTPDCLCIDMGFEITNPRTEVVLINLWRERRIKGKYTFFITPDSQEKIRHRYGDDLYRFFLDKEQCAWVGLGTEK